METYIYHLPTSVLLPRVTKADKRIALNLNVFRNLNHHVNNEVKQSFKPDKIEIFRANKIKVTYFVEKKSKILFDPHNTVAIVQKCFADWLVKMKMIPDDNFKHYVDGGCDGINGCEQSRVIATITVLEE